MHFVAKLISQLSEIQEALFDHWNVFYLHSIHKYGQENIHNNPLRLLFLIKQRKKHYNTKKNEN